MKVLQDLLELQSVDLRLNDVRTRLAAFPKKVAEVDARVAGAKTELEQSKASQLATIKDRKKYELDVEQWKERVRKYKDQTSQIKTNEAYKALQHEVEMAEAEIAKAEDRLLEQMVAAEEYDRRVKASDKLLKEVEIVAAGQRAKIDAEKASGGTGNRSVGRRAQPRGGLDFREFARSLRSHLEEAPPRRARGSARREMLRLRDARAASRLSGNAARGHRRNVPLRDLHANPLLR